MAENALHAVVELVRRSAAVELTDQALLNRFVRNRDEAAFTILLQRHAAMVLAFAGACSGMARMPKTPVTWLALSHADASTAYRAMCSLAAAPDDAVALFQQRLVLAPRPDEKRLAKLIADLDSPQFEVRDAAVKELAKLGDTAVPTCRAALPNAASIEVRRRLQGLIDHQSAEAWTPNPERLRLVRSIEALEMAGSPECRVLLQRCANGAPGHVLTEEAIGSLRRLRDKQPLR